MKRIAPNEYGNEIINNFSEEYGMPPVVFKHWLHRAKYTCRLCHIEIGFVMRTGATLMSMEDLENGLFCGECHNGREAFSLDGERIINGSEESNCDRCHSLDIDVPFNNNFYKYTKDFPRRRFGNGIDWLKAEEDGKIKLKDSLDSSVGYTEDHIEIPPDFQLVPRVKKMPNVLFSHKKHAIWSGCDNCHPALFNKKKTPMGYYRMDEITGGKFCGICHGTVSFPPLECKRCHSEKRRGFAP